MVVSDLRVGAFERSAGHSGLPRLKHRRPLCIWPRL